EREDGGRREARRERVETVTRLPRHRLRLEDRETAEATGIVVGEQAAVVELDHDMIVALVRAVGAGKRHPTRHAEVDEPDPAVVERHEQVLAAAPKVPEAPAGEARREVGRDSTAETALVDGDPGHGAIAELRGKATEQRLDLGQLGHGYCAGTRAEPAAAGGPS